LAEEKRKSEIIGKIDSGEVIRASITHFLSPLSVIILV
jgi:hypothetical protein